jgi:parallel beta-helix repeat protein
MAIKIIAAPIARKNFVLDIGSIWCFVFAQYLSFLKNRRNVYIMPCIKWAWGVKRLNKFLLACLFFVSLFGGLVEGFGMPDVLANETQCGIVNRSISLISNVSSDYACFLITTSHVTLDCRGNNITFGIIGRSIGGSYGVLSGHNTNVTVRNCVIKNGRALTDTSNKYVALNYTTNNVLENNTLASDINITSDVSLGVLLYGSSGARIQGNTIGSNLFGNPGIFLNNSNDNTIIGNILNTGVAGSSHRTLAVLNLLNSSRNVVESNTISSCCEFRIRGIRIWNDTGAKDGNGNPRLLNDTAQDNLFINNNITVAAEALTIDDENQNVNYIVYNNSFGEIRWIDNRSDGYLGNLSVFIRRDKNTTGFGLDRTFFIRDNVIGVNLSLLTDENMFRNGARTLLNSSAQLTFKGLVGKYNQVRKLNGFSTNTTEIQQNGDDCIGTICTLLSYDKDNGIFIFNTTSLGSFAAMEVLPAITITTKANTTSLRVPINMTILVGDRTNGTIWYNLNNEGNATLCTGCTDGGANFSFKSYDNQTLIVYANDSLGLFNSTTFTIQLQLDSDGDGTTDTDDNDDDNDGVADTNDTLVGDSNNINGNLNNITLVVNSSTNSSKDLSGLLEVNFTNGTVPIVEFFYNFSANQSLILGRVHIIKQNDTDTAGSLIVRGINLTEMRKKTVYLDDKDAAKDSVCIKDAEIDSILNISANCTRANEFKVRCDGTASAAGHVCTKVNGRYKITGLSNSGVLETTNPPDPTPGPTGGGGGGGGGGSTPSVVDEEETTVSTPQLAPTPSPIVLEAEEEPEAPAAAETDSNLITGAVVGVNNFRIPLRMSVVALVVVLILGGYVLLHSAFIKKEEKAVRKFVKKKHGKVLIALFVLLLVATVVLANYSAKASTAACIAGKEITYYGSSVGCDGCAQQEEIIKNLQIKRVDCAESMKQCKADGVEAVPSFDIAGEIHEGILTVSRISELSGC